MVKSEVLVAEALVYGRGTWAPLKGHYHKFRAARHRMIVLILPRIASTAIESSELGASRRTNASSSTKTPSKILDVIVFRQPCAIRMDDHGLPRRAGIYLFVFPFFVLSFRYYYYSTVQVVLRKSK